MNLRRLRLTFVLLSLTAGCDPPLQPVANAGMDQPSVAVHQLVQLDGSASKSSDPTLSITRYDWAFLELPSGSAATLNQSNIAKPSFTPDLVGAYKLRLAVYDANGSNEATVTITAAACVPAISAITPTVANVGDDVTLATMITKGAACDDRSPYAYLWSITSLPAGSKAVFLPASSSSGSTSSAVAPVFHADVAGNYVFGLHVTDSAGRASDAAVTVAVGTCGSIAPVAVIAAMPATPNTLDIVQLTAAVSDDNTKAPCSKTEAFSYAWSLQNAPVGSTAALNLAGSATPWIQPDLNGTYVVRLVVTDSTGLKSAPTDFDLVIADCGSKAPVIAAITPSSTSPLLGAMVGLAATVTDDDTKPPCSKPVTFGYAWTLIQQPAGSLAKLAAADTATPTFVPDVAGAYQVQLTVTTNTGKVSQPVQSAVITAGSCGLQAPVAQIGVAIPYLVPAPVAAPPAVAVNAPARAVVQLDGSSSFDPDNAMNCMLAAPQTLSFAWRFESLPVGSSASINDGQVMNPSFVPDVAGNYVIDLVVTDSTGIAGIAARAVVSAYEPALTVASGVGPYSSLALDGPNSDPRIAYYDRVRASAWVATCTGPSCQSAPVWTVSPIEVGNDVGRHISLADNNGNLYAAYWDRSNCVARYAVSTDVGKTWKTSTVQANASGGCQNLGGGNNGDDYGSYTAIAISPVSGSPAVLFTYTVSGGPFGNHTEEVRYAFCTANCTTANPTWNVHTVVAGVQGANYGFSSIAFDPVSQKPSFSFRTSDNGGAGSALGFVQCTAGCEAVAPAAPTFGAAAWIDTGIGFDGSFIRNTPGDSSTTSLQFTSTGQPQVAYYDNNNGWLRLARCMNGGCGNANSWYSLTADAGGNVGAYPSLALSSKAATLDRPRISYLDRTNNLLKFVQWSPLGWSYANLDRSAGGYTSLRLSPNDDPRVSSFSSVLQAVRFYTSSN